MPRELLPTPHRPYLNRVSFRLLVYALVSNLSYAILSLPIFERGESLACTSTAFATNILLIFSGCIFYCMSLNLVLVLVYGVDGRVMEKQYLIGSLFVCMVCSIAPLAAGQYGFWPAGNVCWFADPNPAVQFRWLLGAQSFWLLLLAVAEVISFAVLLSSMLIHQVRTNRAITDVSSQTAPPPPILRSRGLILKIGLYPLCSCIMSFSGSTIDLYGQYSVTHATQFTSLGIRILFIRLVLYSLRGLLFALLAATDPSFTRALRALSCATPASDASTSASTLSGSMADLYTQPPPRRPKRVAFERFASVRVELADRGSTDTRGASPDIHALSTDKRRAQDETRAYPAVDMRWGELTDAPGTQVIGIRGAGKGKRQQFRNHPSLDEIECQI
ncbi:hypothetical protein B0H15DRAFT_299912 [Mycena belliarum]|uniref:G-protein coupled receptors family 2 profile 2 domain-containing protein n=1 Tax=Mycena belliarum TaxID=1033014 RepID=A0AAD6XQP4_9AGAR|nr:hypothetical protein B0H15DRAFT_299912 [Mycena belliae]